MRSRGSNTNNHLRLTLIFRQLLTDTPPYY